VRAQPDAVLFGNPLARNLDAELVGMDEIFLLSFDIFHKFFIIFHLSLLPQ
jgi:hypothetical protein